ncbi:S8 family serine peptidase [Aromatoleum aromaticum]|uniref:Serine proteases, subtilase family n=1 Tax=Aromatoleum aromaticum (strain DSM 19018 / LMG 30748 / EbN1) TaxID=76114 RepID=Q5P7D9_AROAE|nr:S8 family serine peptidase [Aromatoleum aromaticum]NMG53691.1 S8 family serine peptidase [Aromatoleum aromaticum]CAI06772.1 Serine proteases, subtilase family [Aromatoleum aromaticum EbN1]
MNDTPMNTRPNRSRRVSPQRRNVSLLLALALAGSGGSMAAYGADDTPAWVPGRILVQPRPGLPEAAFEKIIKAHGGKSVERIGAINVHIVQLPPNASEKAVAALLSKNKHLKFAERDMIMPPDSTNDPYYSKAWHLPKIGAPTAWNTSTGEQIIIAILDSGVDGSHPDLAGKLLPGWNFYDGNSNTADVTGHGTKVAGTAAAASNNSLGVASVAGGAMVLPGRVASTSGTASYSMMAKGVTWAADKGARVANISYSGARGSLTVQNAAQYLKSKGGLLVTSAGNTGGEEAVAPSDTLIAVSGTTSSDAKASWSSYGSYVDVAAPGAGIYTTVNGGGYGSVSGTSFASPAAAGVVALMMAANSSLSPDDIAGYLFATAVDLGNPGFDKYYGHGRIDAAAAVQAAVTAVAKDTAAPTVSIVSPAGGATVQGVVTVDVAASDNVAVSHVELLANGAKVASAASAPYGFSWDSTTVADGATTLTVRAYDAAGNYASRAVNVTVANTATSGTADTEAPAATISNPGDGSKVSGNITVEAHASDNVGVSSMRLYIDGALVSSVTGNSLSYRWNTRKIAAGPHEVVVDAQDAAGNTDRRIVAVSR